MILYIGNSIPVALLFCSFDFTLRHFCYHDLMKSKGASLQASPPKSNIRREDSCFEKILCSKMKSSPITTLEAQSSSTSKVSRAFSPEAKVHSVVTRPIVSLQLPLANWRTFCVSGPVLI